MPKISMTAHWNSEGTTNLEAGKKTGNPILHKKMN